MNAKLKQIHDYMMVEKGMGEKEMDEFDRHSLHLAMGIYEYAHRSQKRENGEGYANHPFRVFESYRRMIDVNPDGPLCVDLDLLESHHIPFFGVQEVCLLHDVAEDSELTVDDIGEIYVDCGFGDYFRLYMEDALKRITHDKSVPYGDYIEICLGNPVSSLAKLLDLQDNLRIADLAKYGEREYRRAQGYLRYTYLINNAYRFMENAAAYRKAMADKYVPLQEKGKAMPFGL